MVRGERPRLHQAPPIRVPPCSSVVAPCEAVWERLANPRLVVLNNASVAAASRWEWRVKASAFRGFGVFRGGPVSWYFTSCGAYVRSSLGRLVPLSFPSVLGGNLVFPVPPVSHLSLALRSLGPLVLFRVFRGQNSVRLFSDTAPARFSLSWPLVPFVV
jgi:hypothetical protein